MSATNPCLEMQSKSWEDVGDGCEFPKKDGMMDVRVERTVPNGLLLLDDKLDNSRLGVKGSAMTPPPLNEKTRFM